MTLDLDKLENLHQSTTPGTWRWIDSISPNMARLVGAQVTDLYNFGREQYYPTEGAKLNAADMAWIVAAHAAFPAMLDEISDARKVIVAAAERMNALERENEQLRARIEDIEDRGREMDLLT